MKTLVKLLYLENQEIYGLQYFPINSQVSKLYIQIVQPLRLRINNHLSFSEMRFLRFLRTIDWGEDSLDCKEQCWWWTLSRYLTWHCHSETETIWKWHSNILRIKSCSGHRLQSINRVHCPCCCCCFWWRALTSVFAPLLLVFSQFLGRK